MTTTTTRRSPLHPSITIARIECDIDDNNLDDGLGYCWSCGADQYGCEPDARGYTCESCGKPAVYGGEETCLRLI